MHVLVLVVIPFQGAFLVLEEVSLLAQPNALVSFQGKLSSLKENNRPSLPMRVQIYTTNNRVETTC